MRGGGQWPLVSKACLKTSAQLYDIRLANCSCVAISPRGIPSAPVILFVTFSRFFPFVPFPSFSSPFLFPQLHSRHGPAPSQQAEPNETFNHIASALGHHHQHCQSLNKPWPSPPPPAPPPPPPPPALLLLFLTTALAFSSRTFRLSVYNNPTQTITGSRPRQLPTL